MTPSVSNDNYLNGRNICCITLAYKLAIDVSILFITFLLCSPCQEWESEGAQEHHRIIPVSEASTGLPLGFSNMLNVNMVWLASWLNSWSFFNAFGRLLFRTSNCLLLNIRRRSQPVKHVKLMPYICIHIGLLFDMKSKENTSINIIGIKLCLITIQKWLAI